MCDRRLVRLEDGHWETVADLAGLASFRCNDMVVDPRGRAYVGTFGFDLEYCRSRTAARIEIFAVDVPGAGLPCFENSARSPPGLAHPASKISTGAPCPAHPELVEG
jgi:hypothetical protein